MKKIGFIGAYDKTDFMLYVAKILTKMNKTVLIIDTTIVQKAKYVVPVINPTKTYFTEYEDIDVAVGFYSMNRILGYLGVDENMELDYDYVFIDIDSPECFKNFSMEDADINYFVTSFDLYSLKKGLEVLSGVNQKIKMKKILFSKNISKTENEYLDFLSSNYNIEWDEEIIYFPLEQGDQSAIMENQRVSKIKTRNLSNQYRQNLMMLSSEIGENHNYSELKKILRNMDKGV